MVITDIISQKETATHTISDIAIETIVNLQRIVHQITKYEDRLNKGYGRHISILRIGVHSEENIYKFTLPVTTDNCAIRWLSRKYRNSAQGPYYFCLQAKLIKTLRKLYKTCKISQISMLYVQQSQEYISISMDSLKENQLILIPPGTGDSNYLQLEVKEMIKWYNCQRAKTVASMERHHKSLEDLQIEWEDIDYRLDSRDTKLQQMVYELDQLIVSINLNTTNEEGKKIRIRTAYEIIQSQTYNQNLSFPPNKYLWLIDKYDYTRESLGRFCRENEPFHEKKDIRECIFAGEQALEQINLMIPMIQKLAEDVIKIIEDRKRKKRGSPRFRNRD